MGRTFTEEEVRSLIQAAVTEATTPLLKRIAELEAEVTRLQAEIARLKKDSTTSSKPPSSDIVKPPPASRGGGRRRKRRRGGQPGHPRHTRPLFPPEQVDLAWLYEYPPSSLTSEWEPLEEFRVVQQVELVTKLFDVTEHRARLYRSRRTGKLLAAPLPDEVLAAGLVGPRLSALVAYQKGRCHMSYTTIQEFCADVLGLPLSTGQLVNVAQKASAALAFCYEELQRALPRQAVLNVDETGHPENGESLWAWGFHAPGKQGFTFFHIDPSRSCEVLKEFLGETFGGVVGCDYLGAYRKFLRQTGAVLQFCWAHLIRDVKFLTTLLDPVTRRFGEKVLKKIKALFRVWHRRGKTAEASWTSQAKRAQREVLQAVRRAPSRIEAQNLAKRFREHGPYYFTFLQVPGVEPTNNAMERGFRHLVIDRKVTQGTRGEPGRRWCERIWTVLATCVQQGHRAFEFLFQSIVFSFRGQVGPSLLAMPP